MATLPVSGKNSVPNAPDITVYNTTLNLDGSKVYFRDEYFTAGGSSFSLAVVPYSATSVQVYVNGVAQQQGVAFAVVGNAVNFLTDTLTTADLVHVHYWSSTAASALGTQPIGTITGFNDEGNNAPSASWLLMDGSTAYTIASYQTWFDDTDNAGYILSNDGTDFILKTYFVSMYDPNAGTFVSVTAIIKAL